MSIHRSPRLAIGLSLGLGALALASGCDRPGLPSRVPGKSDVMLHVPYPVAEPERIEGAGRKALSEARFVFVVTGRAPSDEHRLPERFDAEGPVALVHHVPAVGDGSRDYLPLQRLAYGNAPPSAGTLVEVEAAEVEALELPPPAAAVWLVGPHGLCRAAVGAPMVGRPTGELDSMVVGYRLDECPDREWAQVAIISDAIPVDFRWVPAQATVDVTLPHAQAWSDVLAEVTVPPLWSHPGEPGFDAARVREIPDVEPRVVQVDRIALATKPELDERPWCEIEVQWSRTDGWFNGRWIDPIPWTRDAVEPFLLGAFVNGGQVDAVIYDDRLDGLVVVPPGPLDDVKDAAAWTQVFVPTGLHDEASLQGWGLQPARDARPVGESCEPSVVAEQADEADEADEAMSPSGDDVREPSR